MLVVKKYGLSFLFSLFTYQMLFNNSVAADYKLIKSTKEYGLFDSRNSTGSAMAEKVIKRSSKRNQDRYKKGNYYAIEVLLIKKHYQEAREKINAFLRATPDAPKLYILLARLESLVNNKSSAKVHYLQAIKLDQQNLFAYQELVGFALEDQQLKEAKLYADKMRFIDNQYFVTYLIYAEIFFRQKKYEQTEVVLKTAYSIVKGSLSKEMAVLSVLGKFYFHQQEMEKTSVLTKDLYKRHPTNRKVLSFYASSLMLNKNYQQAEKILKKIIKLKGKNSKYLIMLARVISADPARKAEVLGLFDMAFNADKKNINALVLKASYLVKNEMIEPALNTANKVIKYFPRIAVGYQLKGDVYLADKKTDKAIAAYRVAYKKDSNSSALFILTKLLVEQEKIEEATNLLKYEVRRSKNKSIINFKLASIYHRISDYKQAEYFYQRVLKERPEHILALNNLAWIYSLQKNPLALKFGEKAYNLLHLSPAIADTYGYILVLQGNVKKGEVQKGLEILRLAAKKAPQISDIQYHLAKAYSVTGDKEKALEILNALAKQQIPYIEQHNAKQLLGSLMVE